MIHHPVLMDALRTARHFPIVYINAHPLVGVRHYAEAFEKVHRLLQVVFEVGTLHRFHKAQIEVALVMVNRPAPEKRRANRILFSCIYFSSTSFRTL